jgi:hypothetical protein
MGRRLSDPAWKSGPTHPEPTSSDHAIAPEDFGCGGFDFDGFGVDEAEQVEGEPLVVIMEQAVCSRDGCDAAHERRLLFTTQPLSDFEKFALGSLSAPDTPAVYVHEHAERVGPETIEVHVENDNYGAEMDVQITAERTIEDEATGSCYGRVEPDPEPEWRGI